MTPPDQNPRIKSRISLIDAARGFALLAMTLYHFTWDLEFFGWLAPAYTQQPQWAYFARAIASSFLFLVGIGLVLGHGNSIRWAGFAKRFAMVAGAAALISIATYFFIPNGFIFFGILHGIALFSLLGLLFVRLHWLIPILTAAGVQYVTQNYSSDVFFEPYFWWVGLAPTAPQANDYVPMFPWFSATLCGIGLGKLAQQMGLFKALSGYSLPRAINTPLTFIGRYSLIFYLIHQPILLGLVWSYTQVAGEPDKAPIFIHQCVQECNRSNGKLFCVPYCNCMVETMKGEKLFTPFLDRAMTDTQTQSLYDVRDMCVAQQK